MDTCGYAELASATVRGRSFWETGELSEIIYLTYDIIEKEGNNNMIQLWKRVIESCVMGHLGVIYQMVISQKYWAS